MTAPSPVQPPLLQIFSIVSFTFVAFLCIGMPLAVLPSYVHDDLAYGSVIAGLVISSQYLSTLLTRPLAGSLSDRLGGKQSVLRGLLGCSLSGVLTLASILLQALPTTSLLLLLAGRIVLGVSQGLVGTGALSWGIGRFGPESTAKVISWNGIAAYGAVAVGAPMGMALVGFAGIWSMAVFIILIGLLAFAVARKQEGAPLFAGKRMPFLSVLWQVLPNGTGLALGTLGFGTLGTFVTLYYNSLGWSGAAWCLSAFGAAFIVARMLFSGTIKRLGGYHVALACLVVETIGLLLIWLAGAPWVAVLGAALTGFGLSLVYPALGVEVVANIQPNSRAAALGAYSVFFDLSLGIAGPLMGAIANAFGFSSIFFCAALASFAGLLLVVYLQRRPRKVVKG